MSLCLKSCISVHFPHQSSWSTQCDQSCCKTSLNHNFSSTVLDSWYKVCVLICCVWVLQMYHFVVWPNNLYCGLVSPKDTALEVLWIVQMQLCKLQLYCYVPFRGMRLSLGAFSKQAVHVQAHSEQDRGIVLTHAGTIQNNKLPKVVRFFDDQFMECI